MAKTDQTKLEHHVHFCTGESSQIKKTGTRGEQKVVDYLVDNLNIEQVGDYRLLVNYNMAVDNPGVIGQLEIDIIVICKIGIFIIEVKSWQGSIEGYPNSWVQNKSRRHVNPIPLLNDKAKMLKSHLTGLRGVLGDRRNVRVEGIVVFSDNNSRFVQQRGKYPKNRIFKRNGNLINILSYPEIMFQGFDLDTLSDTHIVNVFNDLSGNVTTPVEDIVGHYRILGELPAGDSYGNAFSVEHNYIGIERRLKVYKLDALIENQEMKTRQFRRSMRAIATVAVHPNILQTHDFFPDDRRPDIFFEITEAIKGKRLDEYVADFEKGVPLEKQLSIIKDVATALEHAHQFNDGYIKGIFHRRVSPFSIFVNENDVAKLGDFDFAKIVSAEENTVEEEFSIVTPDIFFAPELILTPTAASAKSDVYSLGAVWYWMLSSNSTITDEDKDKDDIDIPNLVIDVEMIDVLSVQDDIKSLLKSMLNRAIVERPKSMQPVIDKIEVIKKITTKG